MIRIKYMRMKNESHHKYINSGELLQNIIKNNQSNFMIWPMSRLLLPLCTACETIAASALGYLYLKK